MPLLAWLGMALAAAVSPRAGWIQAEKSSDNSFKTIGGIMAQDPGIGYRVQATIKGVKGECSAGHRVGDAFDISCHDPGGLCGWFYHDIFPNLSAFQFGGNFPWWEEDTIEVRCPDPHNLVTLRLQRFPRG